MLLMTVLPLLWSSTRSFECQAVPRKTGRLSTQYRLFRFPSSEDGSVVLYNFLKLLPTLLLQLCSQVFRSNKISSYISSILLAYPCLLDPFRSFQICSVTCDTYGMQSKLISIKQTRCRYRTHEAFYSLSAISATIILKGTINQHANPRQKLKIQLACIGSRRMTAGRIRA
jgi:hypothetical protein